MCWGLIIFCSVRDHRPSVSCDIYYLKKYRTFLQFNLNGKPRHLRCFVSAPGNIVTVITLETYAHGVKTNYIPERRDVILFWIQSNNNAHRADGPYARTRRSRVKINSFGRLVTLNNVRIRFVLLFMMPFWTKTETGRREKNIIHIGVGYTHDNIISLYFDAFYKWPDFPLPVVGLFYFFFSFPDSG